MVTSLQQWVKDNDPREAVTSTGLQQDDFKCPGASNMQAKVRHENPRSAEGLWHEQQTRALLKEFGLEWIDTDPVATDNEATI